MKRLAFALAVCWTAAAALALTASADVKITDQAYVRHDGGNDATILDCNNEATTPTPGGDGSGERQQNEPTAAVNPLDHGRMTAGANDYCAVQTVGDAWAGFYYSSNGGASWTNSLLPGYRTDTSTAGQASPLFGFVGGAGDPVQAWDRSNHLYYAGIAFNRTKPANGSIWLARYHWPSVATSPIYEFTTIVSRGTPSPIFLGHFEDKVEVEADKSTASPFQGNVYVCWARFTGSGSNNFVEFARSTDGGHTFTIQKISEGVHGSQSCDIGITRTGAVFVAWRQFDFTPGEDVPQKQRDAVAWAKSTDGGRTFTKPAVAFEFDHFDMTDRNLSGGRARDCGDGPFACQSGYVFGRVDSGPRIAADPVSGDGDDAYVVVEASVPGSETATGTTYGTVTNGIGAAGSIAGLGLETWYSWSSNGGSTWSHAKASAVQYLNNYEQFGNRDDPFFGDYNYVDVDGSKVLMNWTDTRETVAGTDPRYDDPAVAPDNGTDGFDVLQCRVFSAGAWSADNCPNAGGLDQNIFALILG